MPVMVVAGHGPKDPEFSQEFFAGAVTVVVQAKSADGTLATEVLADESGGGWTRVDRFEPGPIQEGAGGESHLSTRTHIDDRCAEATFVDGEQSRRAISHRWRPTRRTGWSRPRRSHR
jgi:hypothetical protein